jgi:hypothetical protein
MPEIIGDFERHEMPDGTSVYYRDSDHSYWRDIKPKGKAWSGTGRLTGVSTVCAPLDFRPDNLMRWAARLNGEGIAILASEGLSCDDVEDMRASLAWLGSADAIWQALQDSELTFEHVRDRAAARGTNVHKHALHALASGAAVPAFDQLTEEERGYARGVMAFWHECEPETLQAEQVVWSDRLGIAGRFDLRARLMGSYRGQSLLGATCMVDAKTSGFIAAKHHGQLAGYDLLARECGIGESERRLILQVGDDGSYELLDSAASHDEFEDALRVYRSAGRIGRATRAARTASAQAAAA